LVSTEEKHRIVRAWLGQGSINIFGMQFAGKDTQCHRLAAWLNGVVISGGDIIRNGPNIPEHVRNEIDKGHLAPTEEFRAIVTPYFGRPDFAGRPLILSSVGRWSGEEAVIIPAAKASGHELRAAVLLDIDEEIVWERWRRMPEAQDRDRRADDDKPGLERRIRLFHDKTLPVLDTYRRANLLETVDGTKSLDDVEKAVLSVLYKRATSQTQS